MTRRPRGKKARESNKGKIRPATLPKPGTFQPLTLKEPEYHMADTTMNIPEPAAPPTPSSTMPPVVSSDDFPYDRIAMLKQAGHEKVVITIKRRAGKGTFATIGPGYSAIPMTIDEVLQVDDFIARNCGGGNFSVTIRDRNNTNQMLLPTFGIFIEGLPYPVARNLNEPATTTPDAIMSPMNPQQLAQLLTMFGGGGALPAGGLGSVGALAGVPPDAQRFIEEQLRKAETDRATAAAELKALQREAAEKERRFAEEMRAAEERVREARHRAEIDALTARIEANRDSAALAKPSMSPAELIAAFAPFVPVLVTMISSGKEAQTKSLEMQQQGFQALMTATMDAAKKPQPNPMEIITQILPLLEMNKKDPIAQVKMFEAQNNAQLQNMAMMTQLLETMANMNAGEQDPMWVRVIEMVGAQIKTISQAGIMDQVAGQRPALPSGAQRVAPQVPLAARPNPMQTIDNAAPVNLAGTSTPAAVVPEVLPHEILPPGVVAMLPLEFQTREWQLIIRALHTEADPEAVGVMIAKHVNHLADFDMLPGTLVGFTDNAEVAFQSLLAPLPISANKPYCEAVVNATLEACVELGLLAVVGEEGEDEGTEEEEEAGDAQDDQPEEEAHPS